MYCCGRDVDIRMAICTHKDWVDHTGGVLRVTSFLLVPLRDMILRVFSGAYVSLSGNPVMETSNMDDVGRLTGMFISCLAVGALIGPPISGAIAHATGGYKVVGCYAGSCIFHRSRDVVFDPSAPETEIPWQALMRTF